MKIQIFSLLTALFLSAPLAAQEQGPFCGAVGTEGCDAIAQDSSIIVGWATGCTVVRGPVDIVNPDGPRVHYGTDNAGVGPAGVITTDAVSLGDGGTATLTFAHPIRNGAGPDFAVFENPFNDYFLELAFVEVSTDGERFVRFPATSLTQIDSQVVSYVEPSDIHNLAGKYRVGYGTPFDLAELADSAGIDIDSIVFVRLVDVVGCIDPQYATYDAYGHIVNDPYPTNDTQWGSGGFDITGVAVLHERVPAGVEQAETVVSRLWPNPTTGRVRIDAAQVNKVEVMDLVGHCVALFKNTNSLDLSGLVNGTYMLRVTLPEGVVVKQVVKN